MNFNSENEVLSLNQKKVYVLYTIDEGDIEKIIGVYDDFHILEKHMKEYVINHLMNKETYNRAEINEDGTYTLYQDNKNMFESVKYSVFIINKPVDLMLREN